MVASGFVPHKHDFEKGHDVYGRICKPADGNVSMGRIGSEVTISIADLCSYSTLVHRFELLGCLKSEYRRTSRKVVGYLSIGESPERASPTPNSLFV